jgi:FtsH-binding integral membrane protein
VTALTALVVASSETLLSLFLGGPQAYIVAFAPLAVVMFGFRPDRMQASTLRLAFFGIAVLYGISFASIAVLATQDPAFAADVARAFFIATAMFAGLSVYGYTSKTDFSPMRSFLVMGVWGLVAASVMNIFFQSSGMSNVIAGVGILLFAGLTVYQTQETKQMYNPAIGAEYLSRLGWAAALNLYISFIAMFQYVLHFLNQR